MMIVFRKTAGRASDLRFVSDDYQLKPGEIAMEGDELPPIETLHDPDVIVIDQREAKRAIFDAQRDAALLIGVEWNGKRWHADQTFQFQVSARLQAWASGLLAPDATAPVRAMDNTINLLSQTEHKLLAGALMAYVQQVWSASWAAKDAIA